MFFLIVPMTNYAQSSSYTTVFDQNPRFRESLDHYSKMIDSLVLWEGVTIQHTYKAYDWREARTARRQQRRQWRHEEEMNRRYYYNDYYWPDYYPGRRGYYYTPNYSYPYYNPYYNRYSPRWKRFDFGRGFRHF